MKLRNYRVTLWRLLGPNSLEQETRFVTVQARSKKRASYAAILATPGIWNVHEVKKA